MSATVYVPRDYSALSLGAGIVADAVVAEAARRKIDLRLVRNGSRGMFWLEPMVEVETAHGRVAYGPVAPADEHEVAAVARVPIAELADPANRLQIRHPSGLVGPAFEVADMLVWGFTAGVLDRLMALAGWELPWDRSRIGELPAEALRLAMRQRRHAAGDT